MFMIVRILLYMFGAGFVWNDDYFKICQEWINNCHISEVWDVWRDCAFAILFDGLILLLCVLRNQCRFPSVNYSRFPAI